ncbi:amidase domain-containing protein [Bacillus sp. FJAT-47783]|uniref:amidase domain-containing protein n=1 Tax=Bacillus sp. FJAT-47783 TaxID=2922712 RepID=UPI001FAD10BE
MEPLYSQVNERLQYLVSKYMRYPTHIEEIELFEKKKRLAEKRNAEIVKAKANIKWPKQVNVKEPVQYVCQYQFMYKQGDSFYIEELSEERMTQFSSSGKLLFDRAIEKDFSTPTNDHVEQHHVQVPNKRISFQYDRLAAVQYAERWWNDHNPKFKNFDVNCTNFVSQCLYAGNAPMRGYPSKTIGWWMQKEDWSFSWSVAHSMKIYLSTSKTGLRAEEVFSPEKLVPGDVICYDFQGDGRFDHTTFVVAKDEQNMPLVNAQTYNSRMRYWSYEDSTAYTPNIKYKFFHIKDDTSK